MQIIQQNRRDFLASLSAVGAGVLGARGSLADEGPPETTTIKLGQYTNICGAPLDIAEDLLRAEGFTDIRYVPDLPVDAVARGDIHFDLETAAWVAHQVDAGEPIMALAGLHPGCYELFAHEPVRTIRDLKGKRIGIAQQLGQSGHLLLTVIAAQVGLDPHGDIDWIASPTASPMELFAEGQVDAFLAFPPEPQELRARKIGRMILSLGTDKPWSQYLLLHHVRQQRVRARSSGRDQALPPSHVQGRRPLRHRAGADRAAVGRPRVHRAIRLRPPDADRDPLRQLARVRSRGRDAVLRASPPRGGHGQRPAPRRSSPTAPTGASSTSSSAS